MQCPKCGAENTDGASFCSLCAMPFAGPEGAGAPSAIDDAQGDWGVPDPYAQPEDPFAAERREEQQRYANQRQKMEEAGGSEAYDAKLSGQLAQSRREQRAKSLVFQTILLLAGMAGAGVAVWLSADWARAVTAAGVAATPSGGTGSSTVGAAFGIAIGLLVAASVLGSAAARIGRKTVWGLTAVAAVITMEAVMLVPYVSARPGSPTGSGTAFGIGVFGLATLLGGLGGSWFGGRDVGY